MLKVEKIIKSFGNIEILKDVSFEAHNKNFYILEGANGSGKSTLFKIIARQLSADSGDIKIGGHSIFTLSKEQVAKQIAMLVQDPKDATIAKLTVLENCLLSLLKDQTPKFKNAKTPQKITFIYEHLNNIGIKHEGLLEKPMSNLSGGQRQIFAFAMATFYQPKLLLLDEPCAALDESASHLLLNMIKKLIKLWDIPAIMISHDLELNKQYGDVILKLKSGILV